MANTIIAGSETWLKLMLAGEDINALRASTGSVPAANWFDSWWDLGTSSKAIDMLQFGSSALDFATESVELIWEDSDLIEEWTSLAKTNQIMSGILSRNISSFLLGATSSWFLEELGTRMLGDGFRDAYDDFLGYWGTSVVELIKARSFVSSERQAKFKEWAQTIWLLEALKRSIDIAKKYAGELYEKMMAAHMEKKVTLSAINRLMDSVYSRWLQEVTDMTFTLLTPGSAKSAYLSVSEWLNKVRMTRQSTGDLATVEFIRDGTALKVRVRDRTRWFTHCYDVANAPDYSYGFFEGDRYEPQLSSFEIDDFIMDVTNLNSEEIVQSDKLTSDLLTYAEKTAWWIPTDSVQDLVSPQSYAANRQFNGVTWIIPNNMVKDVFSYNTFSNLQSDSVINAKVQLEAQSMLIAGKMRLLNTDYETSSTILTEFLEIFACRALACLTPAESPTGKLETVYRNIWGRTMRSSGILTSNDGRLISRDWIKRLLRIFNSDAVPQEARHVAMGASMLKLWLSILDRFGAKSLRAELLGPEREAELAAVTIPTTGTFHMEWTSAKAAGWQNAALNPIVSLEKVYLIRAFLSRLTNGLSKEAAVMALSIAMSFDYDKEWAEDDILINVWIDNV